MVYWSTFERACKANPCARRLSPVPLSTTKTKTLDLVPYPTSLLADPPNPSEPPPVKAPNPSEPPPVEAQNPSESQQAASQQAASQQAASQQKQKQRNAVDPLRIAMETRDPMYAMANQSHRTAMEREEAQRIEALLPALYKSEGGRARGWTYTAFDPLIKARCASGSDLRALQRAKAPFDWTLSDKVSAAFLDFICVAQQIRVALWSLSAKTITLYPAADPTALQSTPLFHVDEGGVPKDFELEGDAFLRFAEANGWTLVPPTSVLKSLGHLTMADLESVGTRLGMHERVGTKMERIAAIGSFKVKQRLGAPIQRSPSANRLEASSAAPSGPNCRE